MTRASLRTSLTLALAVVAAGLLHGASWVYPEWWPCVWLGQTILIGIAVASRPKSALVAGLIVGCLGLSWAFSWAPESLSLCLQTSWLGSRLIYAVLVFWESIEIGLFCWLVALLARRGTRGVVGIPFAWSAVEFLWPKIFPWMLGHTQLEFLPILQIAEFTGPIGIGFVVTAMAAIPAALLVWWRSETEKPNSVRWLAAYGIGAAGLFAAVLGFGHWKLGNWRENLAPRPSLRVAIIQIDPALVGSDVKLRERTSAIRGPVDLICWPESAIGDYESTLADFTDPERTLSYSRNSFESIRPSEGIPCDLLAGGRTYDPGAAEEGPYYQTAFLINRREQILGRYHKRTLLPFGEYVPGQDWYPEIRQWATLDEMIGVGTDASPLVMSNGTRLGLVVCYEDLLPDSVRESARAGADILFSLINATAFEHPLTLRQHERIARLRAVENRRYFVRCSSTGVTCVISPVGEVVAKLDSGIEATLIYDVPAMQGTTFYTEYGNYFAWTSTAFLVLWLTLGYRVRGKKNPFPSAVGR